MLQLTVGERGGRGAQEENILHRLKPEPGMALVFNHMILHEGERVQSGQKYIMRSVSLPLFNGTHTPHTPHTSHTPHTPLIRVWWAGYPVRAC
jgi:hypothetical protein